MKLYRFHVDCGRMGELDGLFVAEASEVEFIIGKYIYFGDVLGKHSDINGRIEANEITAVDVKQSTIDDLVSVGMSGTLSGINPIDYYDPDQEDPEED